MKLRKFNDFKRIYENNPALLSQPGDDLLMSNQPQTNPPPVTIPIKPEKPIRREKDPDKIDKPVINPDRKASTEELDNPPVREIDPGIKPEKPIRREREQDPDKIEQPVIDPQRKAYSEEMESDESQIDLMMNQLSKELGAELRDNVIEYKTPNNTYKIEFFSDPMCFSINGRTMKFLTTAEEVIDYIETEEEAGPAQAQSPNRPGQRFGAQSQKLPTGVQSQMANERKHSHSYKNRYR